MLSSRRRAAFFSILLCSSWAVALSAASQKVWTGATNNLWSVSTNWNGGVPGNTDVAVFPASGALNLSMSNDISVTLTNIIFQGGGYTIAGNDVNLYQGITSASGTGSTPNTFNSKVKLAAQQGFTSSTGNLVFNGGIDLNGFNLTFDGAATTQVFAPIIGNGTVTKNGTGQTLFDAANTYTGVTTIAAGVLNVLNAAGLGASSAGTTVNSGATLHTASIGTLAEPLTLSGTGYDGNAGAFYVEEPVSLALSGAVTISGQTRIRGNVTFSGAIGGTGSLEVVGGTAVLSNAANSFAANVSFPAPWGGTLQAGVDNAIPSGTVITLDTGGTFDLNNHTAKIGGVEGYGGTILLGSGILTVAPQFSHQFVGTISGSGAVDLTDTPMGYGGQDFFQLSPGSIQWTAQTDIYNGPELGMSGGQIGNVVTHNGGVISLSAEASAGNIVSLGGAVQTWIPGAGRGICNSLMLDSASTFYEDILAKGQNGWGWLTVNGTVTLGGATLVIPAPPTPLPAGTFIFIDNAGSSPVSGTFANWPQGVVRPSNGKLYRIRYDDGDGNDVSVTQLAARGDASGDEKGDIVWHNSVTGENSQWIMNGASVAVSSTLPTVPDTNWTIAGVGDLDGDGNADYVWHNNATGSNAVWFMNGPVIGSSAALPDVSDTNWKIAGVGDFDADSKADILWRNSVTGANVLWLMHGATVASSVVLPAVPDTNFHVAGLGDLQGDGKVDIIWRNVVTGDNSAWLMDGGTVALTGTLTAVPDTNWTIAGVGDFQGDGKADILWRNTATGNNSVWLMDAFTTAVSAPLPDVPDTTWTIVKVEDLQGDGNADIVWRNSVVGANAVWFMSGITAAVTAPLPAVADLNWSPGGPP